MSEPDWRKILVAYIALVEHEEGCIFLPQGPEALDGLSAEECALLSEAAIDASKPSDVHLVASLRNGAAELRDGSLS